MSRAKTRHFIVLAFFVIFQVCVGDTRAAIDGENPEVTPRRSVVYMSPRCKRALRGLAILGTSVLLIRTGNHYHRKHTVERKIDEIMDRTMHIPTHHVPGLAKDIESVDDMIGFVDNLRQRLDLSKDQMQFIPGGATIRMGAEDDLDEASSIISMFSGILTGSPGDPISFAQGKELAKIPKDSLSPLVFHATKKDKLEQSDHYSLETDKWFSQDELDRKRSTGLEPSGIGDLDQIERTLLVIHPKSSTAKADNLSLIKKEEFMGYFYSLMGQDGLAKKYWDRTLHKELLRKLPRNERTKKALRAFDFMTQNPRVNAAEFGEAILTLATERSTLSSILRPLRRHIAISLLEDPQFADSYEILSGFMKDFGDSRADYVRESVLEHKLFNQAIERYYARFIVEVYARAAKEKRQVHVYAPVVTIARLARFIDKNQEGLEIPIIIDPKDFVLPTEIPAAKFTNAVLLGVSAPYLVTAPYLVPH